MVQHCYPVNRNGTITPGVGDVQQGNFANGAWLAYDLAQDKGIGGVPIWSAMDNTQQETYVGAISTGYTGGGAVPYVTLRMGLRKKTVRNDGLHGTVPTPFPSSRYRLWSQGDDSWAGPIDVRTKDAPVTTREDWWDDPTGGWGLGVRRPHVSASTFYLQVQFSTDGTGTFGSNPYVELVDNARAGWDWENLPSSPGTVNPTRYDRVIYTSPALDPTAGTHTLTLNSELLRGWESTSPNGGVRDMNDLGIRVYAPENPSDPSLRCFLHKADMFVEEVEPFYDREPDFGIRLVSAGVWRVVDYSDTANFTTGEPLSVGPTGAAITSSTVLTEAVNWAGDLSHPDGRAVPAGDPVVIEFEPPYTGGAQTIPAFNGNFNPSNPAKSMYWREANGAARPIDNLIIRAVDRRNNQRPQIGAGTGGQTVYGVGGWTTSTSIPGPIMRDGHISWAGFRWWNGKGVYNFETRFDAWSETLTIGHYDCHYTGVGGEEFHNPPLNVNGEDVYWETLGYGATAWGEVKSCIRTGYHAIDICDARFGSTEEHSIYDNATIELPTQVLRCSAVGSPTFYPNHPSPFLGYHSNINSLSGGTNYQMSDGYRNRTFYQTASRALPFWASGGEGPSGDGNILLEDCFGYNLGMSDPTAFTVAGQMGDVIFRRLSMRSSFDSTASFTPGGGLVLCWGDSNISEGGRGLPKGMHTNIGQIDGPLDEYGYDQFLAPPTGPSAWRLYYQNSRGPIGTECSGEEGKTGTCYGWSENYVTPSAAYPQTGTAYIHGNVVVEQCFGSGKRDSPIRVAGAKSFTLRRGDYRAYQKNTAVWIDTDGTFPWWNTPFQTLSVSFEDMGDVPSSYGGFKNSTQKVWFGNRGNPFEGGANNLSAAQIDALGSANIWPPWPLSLRDRYASGVGSQKWNGTDYFNPWRFHRFMSGTFYPGMQGGDTRKGSGYQNLVVHWPPLNTYVGVQATALITDPVVNAVVQPAGPIGATIEELDTVTGAMVFSIDRPIAATLEDLDTAMVNFTGPIAGTLTTSDEVTKAQLGSTSGGFIAPITASLVDLDTLTATRPSDTSTAPAASVLVSPGSGDSILTSSGSGDSSIG